MKFSRVSYASSPEHPAALVGGLHLLVSASLLLVESQVSEQRAKRRGGPKKVWLQYGMLDARGNVTSTHVLCFKTISNKNFSNKANIGQYERNPFGGVRMSQAGAGGAAVAVLLAGSMQQGKVSNTVGVNTAGVQLDMHPRFVLSTGKGADGARTQLQWYSSDPAARVQVQGVWIEHHELKLQFEQHEDAGASLLEFTPKYKPVYQPRPGGTADAASGAKTEVAVVAAAPKPVPAVEAPKPVAAASARPMTMSTRGASSRRLSVLPPSIVPPKIAEQLRKRQREEAQPTLASPVAPPAEDDMKCDDGQQESVFNFPDMQQQVKTEAEAEATAAKRAREEPAAAAAAPSFSGYDVGASSLYGSDDLSDGSGSQPMLDVEDPSSDDGLGLDDDDDCASSDSASSLGLGEHGDLSPASSARTPRHEATPFREGHCERPGSADFTSMCGADGSVESEADAQLREMSETFDQAEAAQHKQEELQMQDYFGLSLHAAHYSKRKRHDDAAAAAADVPMEIAKASAPGNPYSLTAYEPSPLHTAAAYSVLPQGLSPPFGALFAPGSFGGHGMDLLHSPLLLGRETNASPLPNLSLAGPPSSPLPHAFMQLDCRGQVSSGFTPPSSMIRAVSASGPVPMHLTGLSPLRMTPLRTPSMGE